MSYTKCLTVEVKLSGRSFVYTNKIKDQNIDP